MARPDVKERHRAAVKAATSRSDFQQKRQATRATRQDVYRARAQRPEAHWRLDHCHATMLVRGVLCDNCNRSNFQEDPEILERAAMYFRTPPFSIPYPLTGQERRVLRERLLLEQGGRCAICGTSDPRPPRRRISCV